MCEIHSEAQAAGGIGVWNISKGKWLLGGLCSSSQHDTDWPKAVSLKVKHSADGGGVVGRCGLQRLRKCRVGYNSEMTFQFVSMVYSGHDATQRHHSWPSGPDVHGVQCVWCVLVERPAWTVTCPFVTDSASSELFTFTNEIQKK